MYPVMNTQILQEEDLIIMIVCVPVSNKPQPYQHGNLIGARNN
jgi:hypothetical protein